MGAAEGWEAQCHLSACAGQWNQTSKAGWILLPFPKLESIDPLTSGGQAHEALKNWEWNPECMNITQNCMNVYVNMIFQT